MSPTLGAAMLVLWVSASLSQSADRFDRPTPEFYRAWLCQLDMASESEWASIISSMPGVTLGREEVRRTSRTTSHSISFESRFVKGRAQWFSTDPAGGSVTIESALLAPLFGSVSDASRWMSSLGPLTPAPLDEDVVKLASVRAYEWMPDDGVMGGSFGRRQSPFSGDLRMEIDNLVAVNVRTNELYAQFSSRPAIRLCQRR
jgi:hypothetical protein